MAEKTFAINTAPHVATIGDVKLQFEPEVIGAAFAEAYSELKTAQQGVKDAGDDVGPAELKAVNEGMRAFLRRFMLPETQQTFDTVRLPDRILVQLMEWVAGLYGGGSGNDHGGPSSGS